LKIKIIIPNSSKAFLATQVDERRHAAGPGVEVDVVCLKEGPVSLEGGVDEALIGPPLLVEARKAEREGYEAIVIDCAMDPGVRAVRELVNIPVTSAISCSSRTRNTPRFMLILYETTLKLDKMFWWL